VDVSESRETPPVCSARSAQGSGRSIPAADQMHEEPPQLTSARAEFSGGQAKSGDAGHAICPVNIKRRVPHSVPRGEAVACRHRDRGIFGHKGVKSDPELGLWPSLLQRAMTLNAVTPGRAAAPMTR